jgi:hypothetical protein
MTVKGRRTVVATLPHSEEVADLVVMLANERTDLTDADFAIDGGLMTTL